MCQRWSDSQPCLELQPGERARFEADAKADRSRYTGVPDWDLPQLNLDAENAPYARAEAAAPQWTPEQVRRAWENAGRKS